MKKLIFLVPVLMFFQSSATHLTSAYFSCANVDNDSTYVIDLHAVRDCQNSTVLLDDTVRFGVYDLGSKKLLKVVAAKLVQTIKDTSRLNCFSSGGASCVERGFYRAIVILPASNAGYRLWYQRCCRTVSDNLIDDGGTPYQGYTITATIPPTGTANTSARINLMENRLHCKGPGYVVYDLHDDDGDSVAIRLVHPFAGGSPTSTGNTPKPQPILKWPAEQVSYRSGYNWSNPFGSSNPAKISGDTLRYDARTPGLFFIGLEVEEWRNGKMVCATRYDHLFRSIDCANIVKNYAHGLTSIYGDKLGINLKWDFCDIDQKTDSVKFDVLRSEDGTNYSKIGEVNTGPRNPSNSYRDNTISVLNRVYHYKIETRDLSGASMGTSNVSSVFIPFYLDQDEVTRMSFNIHPNPIHNFFTLTGVEDVLRVDIHNVMGKELNTLRPYAPGVYGVSDFVDGVYLLEIQTGQGVLWKKVILKRD